MTLSHAVQFKLPSCELCDALEPCGDSILFEYVILQWGRDRCGGEAFTDGLDDFGVLRRGFVGSGDLLATHSPGDERNQWPGSDRGELWDVFVARGGSEPDGSKVGSSIFLGPLYCGVFLMCPRLL